MPSSKFLQNIGLETTAPKKSATPAVRARVQELEAEVQAEKEDSAALKCQIEYQRNQLESLKSKVEEFEAGKQKQQELDNLKKQGEETFTSSSLAVPQQGVGEIHVVIPACKNIQIHAVIGEVI